MNEKRMILTKHTGEQRGVILDDATEEAILNVAEMAAGMMGGPVAIMAVRILKIAQDLMDGVQRDPEFVKYYESLEQLTEAWVRRHGRKP